MKKDKKDSLAAIRKSGLKATPARILIFDLFRKSPEPQNAEIIFQNLKDKKVDRSTIYRNLISLEKMGLIKKVDLRKDSDFFEISADHHHHIVCNSCGLIENFNVCNIRNIENDIIQNARHFNEIKEHSFEMFGLCQKCQTK